MKIKKVNQVKTWVYIYEDEKGVLKICLSAVVGNLTPTILQMVHFVYLRPFEIPFEALAHKHLLDDLSKESVLNWIYKHREETKMWLDFVNENENEK